MSNSAGFEVIVAGAGAVGLSIALELQMRGLRVAVLDRQKATRQATWAAAGMLAVDDPHNPAAMLPLSQLSMSLYPEYLRRVEALSGERVPFQTETVVEHRPGGRVVRRPERSLDPRQLAAGLLLAVRRNNIVLYEEVGEPDVSATRDGVKVRTAHRHELEANYLVHASGAWFGAGSIIRPRKGQMLRVQMPTAMAIQEVHRRADVYVVPRTQGPQAGTALIGATVEDVGFDRGTRESDLNQLRALAGELVPVFGDAAQTPMLEAWAGLRPGTPDGLPLIGALEGSPQQFVATGHFRNGILLAPGTAAVLADMMEGRPERIELAAFRPGRFLS